MSHCAPHQVAEEVPALRSGGLEAEPQEKPVVCVCVCEKAQVSWGWQKWTNTCFCVEVMLKWDINPSNLVQVNRLRNSWMAHLGMCGLLECHSQPVTKTNEIPENTKHWCREIAGDMRVAKQDSNDCEQSTGDLLRIAFVVSCFFCPGYKGFYKQARSRKPEAAKGQECSPLQVQECLQNIRSYQKTGQTLQGFSDEEVRQSRYWDHSSRASVSDQCISKEITE